MAETTIVCPSKRTITWDMKNDVKYDAVSDYRVQWRDNSLGITVYRVDARHYFDMLNLLSKKIIKITKVVMVQRTNTITSTNPPGGQTTTPYEAFTLRYESPFSTRPSNLYFTTNQNTTREEIITDLFNISYITDGTYYIHITAPQVGWLNNEVVFNCTTGGPPHLEITGEFEDWPTPEAPTNLSPTTPQSLQKPITISWQHNPSPVRLMGQQGFELEYKDQGAYQATTVTEAQNTVNSYTLPVGTFETDDYFEYKVRTSSLYTAFGAWSEKIRVALTNPVPLAPTFLSPTTPQDPRGAIKCSWKHNGNPDSPLLQTGWELEYTEKNGTPIPVTKDNTLNEYAFPANSFVTQEVKFRVRAKTRAGFGAWSEYAVFHLTNTPPLPPVLIYPVNNIILAGRITLEWQYRSKYDNAPLQYALEWRSGNDPLNTITLPGVQNTYFLPEFETDTEITWRARAWGAMCDAGDWSDYGNFTIAAKPENPVITNVTNNAKPQITWTSERAPKTFEVQLLHQNQVVYSSGPQSYLNDNVHKLTSFFEDGQYVAQVRIYNEFDFVSDWSSRAFNIITNKPPAPELRIINNPHYSIDLRYQQTAEKMYVYRDDLLIAVTNAAEYQDFTVTPFQRHIYFVRAVKADNSFADSGKASEMLTFTETTIAMSENLSDMVFLHLSQDTQPKYTITAGRKRTVLDFGGREYPVVEFGSSKTRALSLSYFVRREEMGKLDMFLTSDSILLIRDRDFGSHYAAVTSDYSASPVIYLDGYNVSFSATKVSYSGAIS